MTPITTDPAPRWGALFWCLIAMLAIVGVAFATLPELAQQARSTADRFVEPLLQMYQTWIPSPLQPLIVKAASVFLTPWLYLAMLLIFVAERYIPADRTQRVFSIGMLQDFIAWFTLDGLMRALVVGTLVAVLYKLYHPHLEFLTLHVMSDWPPTAQVLMALLVVDFLNWFHHYIRHKVDILWLFHSVHHSQREMNMFTDLRVHFAEHFVAKPIVILPVLMLDLDLEPAFWTVLIRDWYSRVYHANLRTNFGPLRHLFVTPQSHRIHHSADPRHRDRNFGVLLNIWDRIFGTQWPDYDEYPATGITDPAFPHERDVRGTNILFNYLRQLAYPFQAVWARGRAITPASQRADLRDPPTLE
jgi:sterol desaturase/sphingolipid hydroxylase (fatty acid hydroxylase superfamily)